MMRKQILTQLKMIEKEYNVKILLAVESGSRAWGFASSDSDYDVRFIYVRPMEDYLKLETIRDVIELPINDDLDINGWDLQKTLRLLYKSNPTLFEWFSSPIVYIDSPFAGEFRRLMMECFSTKKTLYHYLSMAESNYREYLKTDMVRAKIYFYVLRPLLACRWVLEKMTPPPMLFSELSKAELPTELKSDVDRLLDIKINSPEVKMIPRVDNLNKFLDSEIDEIKSRLELMKENNDNGWDKLNDMFFATISKT